MSAFFVHLAEAAVIRTLAGDRLPPGIRIERAWFSDWGGLQILWSRP